MSRHPRQLLITVMTMSSHQPHRLFDDGDDDDEAKRLTWAMVTTTMLMAMTSHQPHQLLDDDEDDDDARTSTTETIMTS